MSMHRFIPEITALETPPVDPAHTAAIKRWTGEILALAPDDVVHVAEIGCADAGCSLVETVITVLGEGNRRTWRLVRPRVAVTKLMLHQTLASPPA